MWVNSKVNDGDLPHNKVKVRVPVTQVVEVPDQDCLLVRGSIHICLQQVHLVLQNQGQHHLAKGQGKVIKVKCQKYTINVIDFIHKKSCKIKT